MRFDIEESDTNAQIRVGDWVIQFGDGLGMPKDEITEAMVAKVMEFAANDKFTDVKCGTFEGFLAEARYSRSTISEYGLEKRKSLFIGSAGEYQVVSDLIFHGYNANLLPVDYGTDIVAERRGELYRVQVKTSSVETLVLRGIGKEQIIEMAKLSINLIIVFLRQDGAHTRVVLPYPLLYMLTSGGYNDEKAALALRDTKIFTSDDNVYMRNKIHRITPMCNRYDLLASVDMDYTSIPDYASWEESPVVKIDFESD